MLKIAIVTKPLNASPKILAECLDNFIKELGHDSHLFYEINVFKRLLKYENVKNKYNFFLWSIYKLTNYFKDRKFIKGLNQFDAVIVVETSPFGYLKTSYNYAALRELLNGIPLVYHGVYFLGNAPTVVKLLKEGNHHSMDTFDWHLAVSEVTEIRQKPAPPWSQIGLYLKSTGLKPQPKKELFAVVDFKREGHEETRNAQIRALEELNIPYVALEGSFSIAEIREFYKRATFYFIQFGESYGVPIAECLSCGCHILLPDSSWAMAWRLDDEVGIHGPGTLADCFVLYDDEQDLNVKLKSLADNYDLERTPQKIFDTFMDYYPSYYQGNQEALKDFLSRVQDKRLK